MFGKAGFVAFSGLGFLVAQLVCGQSQTDKHQRKEQASALRREEKQRQKQSIAKAKSLVAAASSLEKAGKLQESLERYKDANAAYTLHSATVGVTRTSHAVLESLIQESGKAYAAGDYQRAVSKLNEAEHMAPKSPRVLESTAAAYYKMRDRQKALEYLERCQAALPEGSPERDKIDRYRTLIMTGEPGLELKPDAKAAVTNVNLVLQAKLPPGEDIKDFFALEAEREKSRCHALETNRSQLPKTGAVLFNLAQCAQGEGQFDDAERYFADYMEIAPRSMDKTQVQLELSDINHLLELRGEHATEVRELFAEAYREINRKQYHRALDAYKKAEALEPDYSQAKLKLGMLYAALGDTLEASAYLNTYVSLETHEEAKTSAITLINKLPQQKADFDAEVIEARTDLLNGNLEGLYSGLSALNRAGAIFPLSPELNSLLAYSYLNGNNPSEAVRALDSTWGGGFPVSYYAALQADGLNAHAKVEIEGDTLRLIFLAYLDPHSEGVMERVRHIKKKKAPEQNRPLPTSEAKIPGDHMANLGGPSRLMLAAECKDVLTIQRDDIKAVETKANYTEIRFKRSMEASPVLSRIFSPNEQRTDVITVRLYPQVFGFKAPDQAWPARRFANTYTRMFSQYLGFDGVKLGPEHMSSGEKWKIAGEIALIAASEGQAAGSMSRMILATAMAVQAFSAIQSSILSQRAVAQQLDFKVIPAEPMQLTFRTDDFK